MRHPSGALCAIVVGMAVLVGCAKKPKAEPEVSANTNPAPTPAPVNQGQTGGPAAVPGGRSTTVFTAGGEQPFPGTVPPKTGTEPAPTTAPGAVELTQCRFDKVEAALTSAKGKVVLVDCWALWCPPCVESFPMLVAKHEKYKSKGLVCMSVSIDSGNKRFTPEQVTDFLKKKNSTLQNYYLTDYRADGRAFAERFAYKGGIPHAVVFSKKGERVWDGHPMDDELVARIEAELAK